MMKPSLGYSTGGPQVEATTAEMLCLITQFLSNFLANQKLDM